MSLLNKEEKYIYIHIPKCAGSAMGEIDWNKCRGHFTIRDYSSQINLDDYFKWGFVRNPWDRLVSAYESCPELLKLGVSFSECVDIIYNHRQDIQYKSVTWSGCPDSGLPIGRIHFCPMVSLMRSPKSNKIEMNFIGRFENLKNDWDELCRLINKYPTPLHKSNTRLTKTKRFTPYKDMYDSDLIHKVGAIYEEDIDIFQYTFS
jgi:hypothetical protein